MHIEAYCTTVHTMYMLYKMIEEQSTTLTMRVFTCLLYGYPAFALPYLSFKLSWIMPELAV